MKSVDPASAFHDLIRVDFLAISSLWSHREGRGGPVNSNLHQRERGKEGKETTGVYRRLGDKTVSDEDGGGQVCPGVKCP